MCSSTPFVLGSRAGVRSTSTFGQYKIVSHASPINPFKPAEVDIIRSFLLPPRAFLATISSQRWHYQHHYQNDPEHTFKKNPSSGQPEGIVHELAGTNRHANDSS